jgi:hypothetical protein
MKDDMTLAEILLDQMKGKAEVMQLKEDAPVLPFLPPFLLKELPGGLSREIDYHFEAFPHREALKLKYPAAEIRKGHPKEIYLFLRGNSEAFLDFDQIGCVYLTTIPSGVAKSINKMGRWLDYALSPELWGPEGKWTRFHERLHKLFESNNLLEGGDSPGYYPLKSEARSWENFPFQGDARNGVYALVLPWTFSLTDLGKLESLINEEN